MKVNQAEVETSLRMAGEDSRLRVQAWIDHLKNWETDAFIREHSRKLNSVPDTYALETTDKYVIFFRLEQDQIVVLDVATKATIAMFRPLAESSNK